MYPFLRMTKELAVHARAASLPLTGTHVSWHICWPWDLDLWLELNNGRALTLYDLGRIPLARRTGLVRALRRKRWGMTVAGSSIRYRRRVRVFDRIEMQSRCVGWDARFLYLEQSMWTHGVCASNLLVRMAVTGPQGIVPTEQVIGALGAQVASPPLPGWVRAWIDAESRRPWPPARD